MFIWLKDLKIVVFLASEKSSYITDASIDVKILNKN